MANNFTAEAVSSAGEIFVTRQIGTSSVHYPIGLIAHGASAAEVVTSTSAPFPVSIFASDSAHAVFVVNSSASPLRIVGESGSTSISITGAVTTSTNMTVAALTSASKIQVEPVTSSANRTFVDNNSAHPVFVSGITGGNLGVTVSNPTDTTVSVTGYVAPSTTVTVTGYVAPSTTVTITNSSSAPLFVTGPGADTAHAVVVRGPTDSGVLITALSTVSLIRSNITPAGDTIGPVYTTGSARSVPSGVGITQVVGGAMEIVGESNGLFVTEFASNNSRAALLSFTGQIDSLETLVTASPARLYGYHIGNPDTIANVWLKIYGDDTVAIVLGTNSAMLDLFIPFGGGAVAANLGPGIWSSGGFTITAAGGAGSTNHVAPATTITVSLWYRT